MMLCFPLHCYDCTKLLGLASYFLSTVAFKLLTVTEVIFILGELTILCNSSLFLVSKHLALLR